MVGGVYGDLKEYGGNIAECICCMMCLGPVLLIIGVAVFFQSFSDHRLAAIAEYDLAVSTWNSGPGTDRSFEGLGISAMLATGIVGAATEILMGGVAPEPTGDKSLRPEEKFTEVSNPYYYKNEGAGVSIQAFEPTANSEYTLSFSGESVSKVSTGKVTFKPLIDVSAQYDWYVSRSSSASSDSIDCTNPNYNYPGTRFSSKITCPDWCRQEGGIWNELPKQQCYDESRADTGCCQKTYALKKACFVAKKTTSGDYEIAAGTGKANGCMFSESHVGDASFQREYKRVVNDMAKWSDWPLAYVDASSRSFGQTYDIEISVRHEEDPFISASRITRGCSSGTNTNNWEKFGEAPSDSSQCFGLTPEQLRQIAMYLFAAGAVFSVIPCGVLCFVLQSTKSKKRRAGQQNYAQSNQTQGGAIMLAGPQQPQHVQVIVQQPQPIMVQAQAVPMPTPVQQPMAVPVNANGGDATFVSSK